MNKILDILFSFKTTLTLLALLAIGAGVATFIENDYGTSTARVLVYDNLWYEAVLVLTTVNLMGIIYRRKMWRQKAKFLFHSSFVLILIGAAVTRFAGYEGIMQIREGQTQDLMYSLNPYLQVQIKQKDGSSFYQEYPLEFAASTLRKGMDEGYNTGIVEYFAQKLNNFNYDIKFDNKDLKVNYIDYTVSKKGKAEMGILSVDLTLNGVTKTVRLPGKRGQKGFPKIEDFGDTIVTLEYGSKLLKLPFSIKLNDFQLDRYPGSMSPSSYASEVTVNEENGKSYDYRIFMNRTLHQGNFLFFQSSYDPDEKGTVLSVNNDPGKWPTYAGYFFLTLGLILNLFSKQSRFWILANKLKNKNFASLVVALSLSFATCNLHAAEQQTQQTQASQTQHQVVVKEYKNSEEYMNMLKKDSSSVANKFGLLTVQSNAGRMKPIDTLDREILLKLSGKTSMFDLNADQIVLGMISRPEIWRDVKMIKITTPRLKKFLGIDSSRKYIAFSEVFKDGKYILANEINKATTTKPSDRGTYEKDVIRVDERLNIAYMTYNANLFNMFPNPNDMKSTKWLNPVDAMQTFQGRAQQAVETMVRGFINTIIIEDWENAGKYLDFINAYQRKVGANIIPSERQISNEILFNKIDIFPKLTLAYLLVGFIMLVTSFVVVFNPKIKPKKTTLVAFIVLAILFAAHTFGMGFRWIIAGHAPWSNTYESLLYISWSGVFAGVVFFRKSLLALSASVIVAAIFMFTAHLTSIDPQITNLVPVLKSYWLTIHVSILTASYGFFGLSAIIGFLTLILFIFRKNRPHLDETIKHITYINEMSLIIGLSAITIGNFLGGVWANESWGRYWGWDPKETWAYVSIVVYAIVLHLRFVKSLNNPFVLTTASVLAFSTILMTYFGVNFYLSGMHSYATGDPVPIPMWVYVVTTFVIITIAAAYRNRNLKA
ncbi:cytochrome c biogenesis protein CcsA [Arcobacter sp. KX21116]|uniref:cytochrome c biogenesis protein CcsA n=1 Tax=Arcobacter iocasae TaxID=2906515 RepID=UPI0035D43F94